MRDTPHFDDGGINVMAPMRSALPNHVGPPLGLSHG